MVEDSDEIDEGIKSEPKPLGEKTFKLQSNFGYFHYGINTPSAQICVADFYQRNARTRR